MAQQSSTALAISLSPYSSYPLGGGGRACELAWTLNGGRCHGSSTAVLWWPEGRRGSPAAPRWRARDFSAAAARSRTCTAPRRRRCGGGGVAPPQRRPDEAARLPCGGVTHRRGGYEAMADGLLRVGIRSSGSLFSLCYPFGDGRWSRWRTSYRHMGVFGLPY
jgi:hypothetical protein